ncbi:LysR family transcriptional regulator [Aliivibrio fischeri]|uniref:LysR family transcriptional regulator n=1 Tax=Aliivibrio fischeri TaxID=668 RepID=UPI0012D9D674|nr:LysR family transcriptional regulator [Aliivibrio fischeri]MUK61485.1 LysR family transcriptional regulator [Aliivibrio fischeri]MUK67834.1 LysR family transcriptional regulator [Aliivibrio fischeri]MUK72781.1 LysR family transcriptional regulator [Aliivibrio fischeri]MUK77178.1 LysR family transcriptional regulator [Aliivibrio fischeri]MUL19326.1 LysR family transcriptional regulator [Aliivibrio fischeri]
MFFEKLTKIDLNLLLTLHLLLEEKSVTRAAQRLCLSQSAVSKNLAKLREQFNDPLFSRTAYGLQPTAKARNLQEQLHTLLSHLESITEASNFDPQSSHYRFRLGLVESTYPLLLPHFMSYILNKAPNVMLDTHAWDTNTIKKLQSGEMDIGITGKDLDPKYANITMHTPEDICCKEIYRDSQMCLVRRDHPVLKQEWTLDTYLQQRHVQVRCDGKDQWLLDYKLADRGLERSIGIIVPDFNSAASLCTHTDLVFTAPSHFIKLIAKQLNLVVLPLPTELPQMAYTLFWHQQKENDAANCWLRNTIINHCKDLSVSTIADEH